MITFFKFICFLLHFINPFREIWAALPFFYLFFLLDVLRQMKGHRAILDVLRQMKCHNVRVILDVLRQVKGLIRVILDVLSQVKGYLMYYVR